ncbi:uncharacterized protein LOC126681711 [Mercurialis annua]|uniref:uncharacterized protein LOC126681711 n=1 Tax=Mercurialis annua TaxID=3986 RepID=UPI00215FE023|nr:uncharacterized protein LOC126681711 [Mercurialis annua]
MKPALLGMLQSTVQFYGLANEDPNAHIADFLEICDTFKMNGFTDDAIWLRLFPFTLKNKAKAWLNSLASGSEITNFGQSDGESLHEAWDRFRELQRSCPHHNLPNELLMQTFYNGASEATRGMIDAAAGGSLMKSNEKAKQTPAKEQLPKGVYSVDQATALQAQVDVLTKQMQNMFVAAVQASCDLCGQLGHNSFECYLAAPSDTEQVNFVVAQGQGRGGNNPYSKTYNPGWRNHPNFSWSNSANNAPRPAQGPPGFQRPPPPQDRLGAFESKMDKFMESITNRFKIQDQNQKNLEEKFDHITKNQSSAIHDLEVHFGIMVNTMAARNPGSLPIHTKNPRDVKAMTLRSVKELEPSFKSHEKTPVHEKEVKIEEKQEVDTPLKNYVPPPPFVPKIPFPQRLKKQQNYQQFANFLDKVIRNCKSISLRRKHWSKCLIMQSSSKTS